MTHDNVTDIVVRPNLDAYYYGFYPTNCEPVDRILGTVAYAGKCYHHTEDWADKNSEGVSPLDNIQAAAIEAADTIATLRKQLANAREALREYLEAEEIDDPVIRMQELSVCREQARKALSAIKGDKS